MPYFSNQFALPLEFQTWFSLYAFIHKTNVKECCSSGEVEGDWHGVDSIQKGLKYLSYFVGVKEVVFMYLLGIQSTTVHSGSCCGTSRGTRPKTYNR